MNVLNLKLPNLLISLIKEGKWNISFLEMEKMLGIFNEKIESPCLYSHEMMHSENEYIRNLDEYILDDFLGSPNLGIGRIDINKLLLIGDIGVDSPFGLYYGFGINPKVIFSYENKDDFSYWKVISESFDDFWDSLKKEQGIPPRE